jgi:hypothetical protein
MELPYDGDTNDPNQRCAHGTFIGSWWGPDYLCQWCEDGISVEEMHRIEAEAAEYRQTQAYERAERLYEACVEAGVHPSVTTMACIAFAESSGLLPWTGRS